MSRYHEDRRYMSHEVRIAEGFMKAPDMSSPAMRRKAADARIAAIMPDMVEAKARGYAARRAGDAEAYAKAVEDVAYYRRRIEAAEEAAR